MTFKPKLVCLTQSNNKLHEFCSELKVNPNFVGRGPYSASPDSRSPALLGLSNFFNQLILRLQVGLKMEK